MKINRGDSQDKGSQSRQAYHAAPAPAPKRPVQPDPDPQDLYEDAEGPDEYAEDEEDVNEDAQLVILSVGEDSEGEYLDVVEDDETLMEVSKLFEQRLSDQFEIE